MTSTPSNSVPWWRGAVIYQIWPRSFADGDGDGIGDLNGVMSRLDYLNDGRGGGLGVNGIWISPIFASPMVDFGYDISDYTALDPAFGTLEDLDLLVEECHRRGVRILLDLVPNHTSARHPWFLESRVSRDNPKRAWYRWRDPGPGGAPPNNWLSAFAAVGPAWTLDDATGQYYHHSYTKSQPDLNWDNPEVREAMLDVVRFWFDRGIDGFRIDVAHRLGKDPQYRDNPGSGLESEPTGPGRHDADWPSGLEYLRDIRGVADEYGERLLVGEVYVLDQLRLIEYLIDGDGLHLAHNFVFLTQQWNSVALGSTIKMFEGQAGHTVQPAWAFNNHDHSRVRTRLDWDMRGDERARAAAMLLLGLRGTIFIYQGEELGMPDSPTTPEAAVDVDGRDPARTPIPWAAPSRAGPGAGFTTGTPWLSLGATAEDINVENQLNEADSNLDLYRRLIRIRRDSPALREGSFREVYRDQKVLAFEREAGREVVRVVINFSTDSVEIPAVAGAGESQILASSVRSATVDPGRLSPLEARWSHIVPHKTTKSLASSQFGT